MNSVPRHVAEEDQFIFYRYLASKRTIIPIKNIRINLFVNNIWDITTFIRTTNSRAFKIKDFPLEIGRAFPRRLFSSLTQKPWELGCSKPVTKPGASVPLRVALCDSDARGCERKLQNPPIRVVSRAKMCVAQCIHPLIYPTHANHLTESAEFQEFLFYHFALFFPLSKDQ